MGARAWMWALALACNGGEDVPSTETDADTDADTDSDTDADTDTDTDADSDSDTDTDVSCADAPVCDGDPDCHFLVGQVDGLVVSCYRNASDGDRLYLHVETDGLPDHWYSTGPANVGALGYSTEIPLEPPTPAGTETEACPDGNEPGRLGGKGVAINGVPLMYPLSAHLIDPVNPPPGEPAQVVDVCNGHPAPAPDLTSAFDVYHYHLNPVCLFGVYDTRTGALAEGQGQPSDEPFLETAYERDEWPKPSGVIGFTFSGQPLYGPHADAAGSAHAGLDACNGKTVAGSYGFYTTDHFPYLMGCEGPGLAVDQADWSCTSAPPPGAP